jgi:hypothetical protein
VSDGSVGAVTAPQPQFVPFAPWLSGSDGGEPQGSLFPLQQQLQAVQPLPPTAAEDENATGDEGDEPEEGQPEETDNVTTDDTDQAEDSADSPAPAAAEPPPEDEPSESPDEAPDDQPPLDVEPGATPIPE